VIHEERRENAAAELLFLFYAAFGGINLPSQDRFAHIAAKAFGFGESSTDAFGFRETVAGSFRHGVAGVRDSVGGVVGSPASGDAAVGKLPEVACWFTGPCDGVGAGGSGNCSACCCGLGF